MALDIRYIPLSFISKSDDVEKQLLNTSVLKGVYNKYNNCVSLSDVIISTQYGYTASAKSEGSNRLLRITDINNGIVNWDKVPFCNCESPDNYELHAGDVLIARTGNNISYLVGKDVPEKAVFASYLIRIVCNTNLIIPEYLFMFLNSYVFWPQILSKQRGALLQNVNAKLMGQLEIPLCPISEQIKVTSGMYETETDRRNTRLLTLFRTYTEFKHNLGSQQELLNKLRQAFLREAMQGKLVPQDPNDEPAEELLKRIKAEKARLIKEKKQKPGKELPPIKPEEIPYPIPDNWIWCRLGDICLNITDGFHNTPPKALKGFPYISALNVKGNGIDWNNCSYVDEEYHRELYNKTSPQKGDILVVNIGAGCGTAVVIDIEYEFSFKNVAILKLKQELIANNWIKYFFILNKQQIYNTLTKGGLQPFLSLKILNDIVIPIPSITEQIRLVDKIDNLMKICDEMQENILQSKDLNDRLLQSSLREALSNNN